MAKKTAKAAAKPVKKLTLTQMLSPIGFDKKQEVTLRCLGLRRIRHTVQVPDTIGIRGMIHKVRHMIQVGDNPVGNKKAGL